MTLSRPSIATRRVSCRFNTPAEETFSYDTGRLVRRIGLAQNRLVEVEAEPDWGDFSNAAAFIASADQICAWRIALFTESGRLSIEEPAKAAIAGRAPPAEALASADATIVCPCNNVSRADLLALFDQGLSVEAIANRTNATKTCGGCKLDVEELGGIHSLRPATLVSKQRLDRLHTRFTFCTDTPGEAPPNAAASITIEASIDDRKVRRSYTLVDCDPSRGAHTIIVRRESNGVVSQWLADYADTSSQFRISEAHGGFRLDETPEIVCIAGGIGITPALSVLQRSKRLGGARVRIIWSARDTENSLLLAELRQRVDAVAGASLVVWDSTRQGRLGIDGLRQLAAPSPGARVHVCGPVAFMDTLEAWLQAVGWRASDILFESFYPRTLATRRIEQLEGFDYDTEPCVAKSFNLQPVTGVHEEAEAFLKQFYYEHGAVKAFAARMQEVRDCINATGQYAHTFEELAYGARIAWRNNTRCIGRFFWRTLAVVDRRDAQTEQEVFSALLEHIEKGTNGGDLMPVISVFKACAEPIRILNPQLLLYAGYRRPDGTVVGDPKNIALTEYAQSLGWHAPGTRFDILPIIIQIGERRPRLFEIPARYVLEVPISHPECEAIAALGLRWFALPAVSGMALDVGGIQYTAAPSNGFYMGTEIGSFNLSQKDRYDVLPDFATALGIKACDDNPMWKDQCVVEVNRAVLYSFRKQGVRILDHHSLADYFQRFQVNEQQAGRTVYGHWPWIVPPVSANLSPVWHDKRLKNRILKPNYFYQDPQRWSQPNGLHFGAGQDASAHG